MGAMASKITSLTIVYSTVCSGADQRKHQSSASLAFVRGIHRSPVKSPHKWPVTRKMFPFDNVIMEELDQHWLRCWLIALWHQAIKWTSECWLNHRHQPGGHWWSRKTSCVVSFWNLLGASTILLSRGLSTLAQVMACCLTAPSHYLNQNFIAIELLQIDLLNFFVGYSTRHMSLLVRSV